MSIKSYLPQVFKSFSALLSSILFFGLYKILPGNTRDVTFARVYLLREKEERRDLNISVVYNLNYKYKLRVRSIFYPFVALEKD